MTTPTFQPPAETPPTFTWRCAACGAVNTETVEGAKTGTGCTVCGPTTSPVEVVLEVIQSHRRVRNVRACTGCGWRPERPGYASDPDDTRRRHDQFNRHLAELIVEVAR